MHKGSKVNGKMGSSPFGYCRWSGISLVVDFFLSRENSGSGVEHIPMESNPATAHMFIVNPLTGGGVMTLFSTHPPIEERIKRLELAAHERTSL